MIIFRAPPLVCLSIIVTSLHMTRSSSSVIANDQILEVAKAWERGYPSNESLIPEPLSNAAWERGYPSDESLVPEPLSHVAQEWGYTKSTQRHLILQRPYVILCSWLCLCKKGTVDNKVDTRDKSSVCFAHLNPSQVCRRRWYCDMEVGWQLKDARTKQFMPSFIKSIFCTNHTMLYIQCGSIYVVKKMAGHL